MTLLTQISDSYQRVTILDDGDMSVDQTSFDFAIESMDMGSIQMIWTGCDTKKAKFIPEVSNDKMNWCSLLPDSALKSSSIGSGCAMYDFPTLTYHYIRLRYSSVNATTGQLRAILFLKRRRSNNS